MDTIEGKKLREREREKKNCRRMDVCLFFVTKTKMIIIYEYRLKKFDVKERDLFFQLYECSRKS